MNRHILYSFVFLFFISCGKDIAILHINDTHSHLEGSNLFCQDESDSFNIDLGGYDLIAQFVKEERSKKKETLFLHAGDLIVGTRYFREYSGISDVEFMNRAGLDVMSAGNHEFDKGPEFLENLLEKAHFPVVASNIEITDMPELRKIIKPYIITGTWPFKNGVIGVVTPDTDKISSPGEKIKFSDPAESVGKYIEILREKGVRRIIVLSHLGYREDIELAKSVVGIDVIVGGHSHTVLGKTGLSCLPSSGNYPEVVKDPEGRDVLIVHAWDHARAVGQLDLKFDIRGNVKSYIGEVHFLVKDDTKLPKTGTFKKINPDVEFTDLVSSYIEPIRKEYEKVIGSSAQNLVHKWEKGSDIAPLVAKAIYTELNNEGIKVDVALQNAGGVRRSLEKGDLTLGDVNDALPFFNDTMIFKIRGQDLVKSVNDSLESIVNGKHIGSFPYLYGIRYEIENYKAVKFSVLKEEEYVPFDPEQYYILATDSYIAYGGNGYEIIGEIKDKKSSGFVVSDLFSRYIMNMKTIHKLEYSHPSMGSKAE
jgi:5'-nucleotidase / UDP-sugar diphosphatase